MLRCAMTWAESRTRAPEFVAAPGFGLRRLCRIGRWDLSLTLVDGAFGSIRQERRSNCGGAEMRLGDSVGRV
jgi:hypothetical protein